MNTAETAGLQRLPRRFYSSALLGVFLEYLDYTLYGFSAPYIAVDFFPAESRVVQLLLSWAIFSVSFLVRPLGAIIFGHLADRFGRRTILTYSILLMSSATLAIGLLPTFAHIGLLAPLALLLCRILQGLAVSTEYSGCSTYVLEFAQRRKGLDSGIITSASGFGVFAASGLVLLFGGQEWRWPFIIGGVVVGVLGFYLRRGIPESPQFLVAQRDQQVVKVPLFKLLKQAPKRLVAGILVSAYVGIVIIVIEIYLPSQWQSYYGMSKDHALALVTLLSWLEAVLAIGFGALSDYVGRKRTFMLAGILMIVGIVPLLMLFHHGSFWMWVGAALGLAILVALADGPTSVFLTENFTTEVRYTGVSMSYNIGAGLIGGLSPALLTLLQMHVSFGVLLPAYLMGSAVLMLLVLFFS